jgi:hypothetical protein
VLLNISGRDVAFFFSVLTRVSAALRLVNHAAGPDEQRLSCIAQAVEVGEVVNIVRIKITESLASSIRTCRHRYVLCNVLWIRVCHVASPSMSCNAASGDEMCAFVPRHR